MSKRSLSPTNIIEPTDIPAVTSGLPRWMAEPMKISQNYNQSTETEVGFESFRISTKMQQRLVNHDITHLFPVQQQCVKLLYSSRYSTHAKQRDLLVSAATGSGKTLGYVIPIVEALESRVIPRIRALVVVPTRDLAVQVKTSFEDICGDLKVMMIVGQNSFEKEQGALVKDNDSMDGVESDANPREGRYESKVDILIATPGRLMDHLQSTPGFTLVHLWYLVMDEADRLMNQHYQGWIDILYKSISEDQDKLSDVSITAKCEKDRKPLMKRRVQKLLFSATLTRNAEKIEKLKLFDPLYIALSVDTLVRFSLPSTLSEEYCVVSATQKPLLLLNMLVNQPIKGTLIFVKSVQAVSRLATLIEASLGALDSSIKIAPLSSSQTPAERRKLVERFQSGDLTALVCSDIMTRGMDLNQSVETIVNYDVPTSLVTYIHRVGRTARAGKAGNAITLLESEQEGWYHKEIGGSNVGVERKGVDKVKAVFLDPVSIAYDVGLKVLKETFSARKKIRAKEPAKIDSSDSSSSSSDDDDIAEPAVEETVIEATAASWNDAGWN